MSQILYVVKKPVNCGCYDLLFDNGSGPITVESYDSNCIPAEYCSCYLDVIDVQYNYPTAATYFDIDMITPIGPITADGSIVITVDLSRSTCYFNGSMQDEPFIVHSITRSNMSSGISFTWPQLYCSGMTPPPCVIGAFDTTEITPISITTTTDTITINGLIAVAYDGYIPVMNYYTNVMDFNRCVASLQLTEFLPYILAYDDPGSGACAPPGGPGGVITFEYRVINNSLTAIPSGTDFNINFSSGDFVLPGTLDHVLEDVDYTITNPNSSNVEIILSEDWLPGEVLKFNYLITDNLCATTGVLTAKFTQFNTTRFTPLPLELNITIL